jgi:hypothetical protein
MAAPSAAWIRRRSTECPTVDTDVSGSEAVESRDAFRSQLRLTWTRFQRALRSPRPFSSWLWIRNLVTAAIADFGAITGCAVWMRRHHANKRAISCIPIFGVGLVLSVLFAYTASLRAVVIQRWCDPEEISCHWIVIHDVLTIYFVTMIVFHYTATVLTSPGVVVSGTTPVRWNALDGQGGVWGYNLEVDAEAEAQRLAMYGTFLRPSDSAPTRGYCATTTANTAPIAASSTAAQIMIPDDLASFCATCKVWRPPRAHHCGCCKRCVLQFDHHCVWVNNCIGYHNYRSFVLLLAFLSIACGYGVALLWHEFYDPLRDQIRLHGWKWLYSNGTGLLDLPQPIQLTKMLLSGTVEAKVIVDLVLPLLFGVAVIMTTFFCFHLQYILTAHTTLEHRIYLEHALAQQYQIRQGASSTIRIVNPFDQGWQKNWQHTMGPNPWMLLFPRRFAPPPSVVPTRADHLR